MKPLKQQAVKEDLIDKYCIKEKCEKKNPVTCFEKYNEINNYKISQLKTIAKKYDLKQSGNKNDLKIRIYCFFYLSFFIIKIQKNVRRNIVKKYKKLHGPAGLNRKLCNNLNDFVTMESVKEINFHQFVSYKDIDGFIYGFNIVSFYNLLLKSKNINSFKNPYNRNLIPDFEITKINSIIRISKILNINVKLTYEDENKNMSNEKKIELRTLSLFQNIDALGNYSDLNWFLSLNKKELLKFIVELNDIWNYRVDIPIETKRKICPPHGQPFKNLSLLYIQQYIQQEENICKIRIFILEILENLVNCGENNEYKSLGCYYVLGCLTIVNDNAAASLPWLFQCFRY